MTRIRRAELSDDRALARIDFETWSAQVSPGPRPALDTPFFVAGDRWREVLVAEIDGLLVGYVQLGPVLPLRSTAHVVEIKGLAVDPAHQGKGIGRALLQAAAELARERGARRLTLRVLAVNARARRLYEAFGFRVEGVLKELFLLAGEYVDDVRMSIDLG